jgi:hypothetical protein
MATFFNTSLSAYGAFEHFKCLDYSIIAHIFKVSLQREYGTRLEA